MTIEAVTTETTGLVNQAALGKFVDRIERLHDERKVLNGTIQAVYDEAKDAGFQTPVLREIVKERQMEPNVRHARYRLLDAYRSALGLYAETPLGQAAMARAETETMTKPPLKPFAAQPVHRAAAPRRERKIIFDRERPTGAA